MRPAMVAAALPQANVDTDQIMLNQFLKGIDRRGLADGFCLFFALISGIHEPFVTRNPLRMENIALGVQADICVASITSSMVRTIN
jgi:3-isopropylmalate dehydratase small subunit